MKNLLRYAFAATLVALSLTTVAQGKGYLKYSANAPVDMALIYQGGTHRLDWTKEQFYPHLVHTYADGHKSWMFDSFLFLEFESSRPDGAGFGHLYGSHPATKEDWEWLLGRIFEKGKSLDALNTAIGEIKAEGNLPEMKHRVVLTLCVPINNQTNWGSLDGEELSFRKQTHKEKAIKWYMDELLSRFNAGNYENLELAGFYWLEEEYAISSKTGCALLPYLEKTIHELGYKFFWIPCWYGQEAATKYKEYGFDYAYLQPNHFFSTDIPDSRISDATTVASSHEMGLEVEFDATCPYDYPASNYSRLKTYLDTYEEDGVFDQAMVAYYMGTRGFLDMVESKNINDIQIMDRMASYIEKRHNSVSAVADLATDSHDTFAVVGSSAIVISDDAPDAQVYAANGSLVASGSGSHSCAPGFYIAVNNGRAIKLFVQ